MKIRPRPLATAVLVLLLPSLWIVGQRSATASVAHGLLLAPAAGLGAVVLGLAIRSRRRGPALAAVAVLFPALALSAVRSLREAKPAAPAAAGGRVSIVTQNLLFNARQDGLVALLRRTPADVLCLQEVTPAWARRLDSALGATHPWRGLEPRPGAYGVAIYSRLPLSHPTVVRDARRIAGQCVALALDGAETTLCNVHLSSPAGIVARRERWLPGFEANARVRAAQWRLLREHVAREYPASRHLVVAGDFNTLESEPLYRTLRASLVDAFQAAGKGRGATFPTEPTSPIPLLRIDYVFASPGLAPIEAEVLPQAGSDHRGLRVTLALPAAGTAPVNAGGFAAPARP